MLSIECLSSTRQVREDIFNRAVPKLRPDLLDVQYRLKENGTLPVIVLISGVRGVGKASAPGRRALEPWTLVESNDKRCAHIKVLKTICKRIERALDAL